jgi:hypothetical protein
MPVAIATGINDTSGKFATGVNDTGDKQWEQLSNCLQLKMSLKKNYLYANSTTQKCPKEISIFGLFACATVVVHLELRISSRIF